MINIYRVSLTTLVLILSTIFLTSINLYSADSLIIARYGSDHDDGSWTANITVNREIFYDFNDQPRTPEQLIDFLEQHRSLIVLLAPIDSGKNISKKKKNPPNQHRDISHRRPRDLILIFNRNRDSQIKSNTRIASRTQDFTLGEVNLLCAAAEKSLFIAGIENEGFDLSDPMFNRFALLKFNMHQKDRHFIMSLGIGPQDHYDEILDKLVDNIKKNSQAKNSNSSSEQRVIPLNPFSKPFLPSADQIQSPTNWPYHKDWRFIPFITIDGEDAKDFDDAVYAEPDQDPNNRDGFRILVAIADVSYFVQPYTLLDFKAQELGNSVYLPKKVKPMLPKNLSNDLCSLVPGEDRATLAVEIFIDKNGKTTRPSQFFRVLIKSAARLTYQQVQQAYQHKPAVVPGKIRDEVIPHLYNAYKILNMARIKRGSLELNKPDIGIKFTADGAKTIIRPRYDSHRLIEELMILANCEAANFLITHNTPFLYRIHPAPNKGNLNALKNWLQDKYLGGEKFTDLNAAALTKILEIFFDGKYENVVLEMVLAAQERAVYSPENIGHFGLNLENYCHFTSPIRRYADLLIHRAIISVIENNQKAYPYTYKQLADIGKKISDSEQSSSRKERNAVKKLSELCGQKNDQQ